MQAVAAGQKRLRESASLDGVDYNSFSTSDNNKQQGGYHSDQQQQQQQQHHQQGSLGQQRQSGSDRQGGIFGRFKGFLKRINLPGPLREGASKTTGAVSRLIKDVIGFRRRSATAATAASRVPAQSSTSAPSVPGHIGTFGQFVARQQHQQHQQQQASSVFNVGRIQPSSVVAIEDEDDEDDLTREAALAADRAAAADDSSDDGSEFEEIAEQSIVRTIADSLAEELAAIGTSQSPLVEYVHQRGSLDSSPESLASIRSKFNNKHDMAKQSNNNNKKNNRKKTTDTANNGGIHITPTKPNGSAAMNEQPDVVPPPFSKRKLNGWNMFSKPKASDFDSPMTQGSSSSIRSRSKHSWERRSTAAETPANPFGNIIVIDDDDDSDDNNNNENNGNSRDAAVTVVRVGSIHETPRKLNGTSPATPTAKTAQRATVTTPLRNGFRDSGTPRRPSATIQRPATPMSQRVNGSVTTPTSAKHHRQTSTRPSADQVNSILQRMKNPTAVPDVVDHRQVANNGTTAFLPKTPASATNPLHYALLSSSSSSSLRLQTPARKHHHHHHHHQQQRSRPGTPMSELAHSMSTVDLAKERSESFMKQYKQLDAQYDAAQRKAGRQRATEEDINKRLEVLRRRDSKPRLPTLPPGAAEHARSAQSKGKLILQTAHNMEIRGEDLATLGARQWLNDNVINFYLNMVKQRALESSSSSSSSSPADKKLPTYHTFSTFFYSKLCRPNGFDTVKRSTRRIDLFSFEVVSMPVHLDVHWCMSVIDFRSRTIDYYDSLLHSGYRHLERIMNYICAEHVDKKQGAPLPGAEVQPNQPSVPVIKPAPSAPKTALVHDKQIQISDAEAVKLTRFDPSNVGVHQWTCGEWRLTERQDIPTQKNGYDCGVFACTFAEFASRDVKPTFTQGDMEYLRVRMTLEILNNKFY